jgi:hypothetical protein
MLYHYQIGDVMGERPPVATLSIQADSWESGLIALYQGDSPAAQQAQALLRQGLVLTETNSDDDRFKPCGCQRTGLTSALAIWTCEACGEQQRSRRPSARQPQRCRGCGRVKPPNPVGIDPEHDAPVPARPGRLPHPEVEYFAVDGERGSFLDREGTRRCVGCQCAEFDGVGLE